MAKKPAPKQQPKGNAEQDGPDPILIGPKKYKAAVARVSGMSRRKAALLAGCSAKSIERWEYKRDPEYVAHWDDAKAELRRQTWPEVWVTLRNKLRSRNERVQVAAAARLLAVLEGRGAQVLIDPGDAPPGMRVTVETLLTDAAQFPIPPDPMGDGEEDDDGDAGEADIRDNAGPAGGLGL